MEEGISRKKKRELTDIEIKDQEHEKKWLELAKFAFEESPGLINMVDLDKNGALMSVLQILLEIEPLVKYFIISNQEGPYFKQMHRLYAEAYRNPKMI